MRFKCDCREELQREIEPGGTMLKLKYWYRMMRRAMLNSNKKPEESTTCVVIVAILGCMGVCVAITWLPPSSCLQEGGEADLEQNLMS